MTSFYCRIDFAVVPRSAVCCYVIASYLGSKRIFKIFDIKWSYDKMFVDWVRSGRTGKYLARGQDVRTERSEVRSYILLTEHWTYLPLNIPKTKAVGFANARPICRCCQVLQNFVLLQENQMTVKISIGWIQSNSKLVSWPNTGHQTSMRCLRCDFSDRKI